MEEQAADARAVIEQVAGGRAHVAGHSYGGGVALQLTLAAPDAVQSLILMETLPPASVPSLEAFFGKVGPIAETWTAGDKTGAVQAFLDLVFGAGWEPLVEAHMPAGWFERAVADIDGFFTTELPAFGPWMESQPDAASIKQPVLSILGANSDPYFAEVDGLIHELLPQTETFVVPGASHGLQFMNPTAVTEALLVFCAKHPMRVAARG
jgi:pimeloyl-ACP methyl ester carboxylesterase